MCFARLIGTQLLYARLALLHGRPYICMPASHGSTLLYYTSQLLIHTLGQHVITDASLLFAVSGVRLWRATL